MRTAADEISVCICTYHRDEMLAHLIRKLSVQETNGLFKISAVVIDNDISGPSQETVLELKNNLRMNLAYAIGSDNNIPMARNHAIRLSQGNYIAIIDDDEFPPPNWLSAMLCGLKTFDVDGVLGPVRPYFRDVPPQWLIKSNLCCRPFSTTGTMLNWNQTRTGNCLIKREVFDKHRIFFDESFKTGGEDQNFFRRAMAANCRFVAVEEAPVYEVVPPERWTKTYYLKRALINGYNAQKYLRGAAAATRMLSAGKSIVAVAFYSLCMPLFALKGTPTVMKYVEKGANHFSRLAGSMRIEIVKDRNF